MSDESRTLGVVREDLLLTEMDADHHTASSPTVVDRDLLLQRKVFLTGEVNTESIMRVVKELFYLDEQNKLPITLYVNTEGGYTYEIFTLYDVVRKQIKSKVNVVVLGYAMSSGAFIVATCSTGKRYAGMNSTFMIHESSAETGGKVSDMEINVKETKRIDKRLNDLMAKHTTMKKADLNHKFLKDSYFTSKKALELGLIDQIL